MYKCGQCGEPAIVIADKDMDNPCTSPPTTVWVVCDDCGYAIPKDTADKILLLAACVHAKTILALLRPSECICSPTMVHVCDKCTADKELDNLQAVIKAAKP